MTNILSLPLLNIEARVASNEDWLDTISFVVAGVAYSYPNATNVGKGMLGEVVVSANAPLGNCVLTVVSYGTSNSVFVLTDANGNQLGIGTVGIPFDSSGLQFTLYESATAFVAGDAFVIAVQPVPINISGISFSMMVRQQTETPNVALFASTNIHTLISGNENGQLRISISQSLIHTQLLPQKEPYVFDILASADGYQRRIVEGLLNVERGVTVGNNTITNGGGGVIVGGVDSLDALAALINSLPTTQPSSPGLLWLNGGLLAVS